MKKSLFLVSLGIILLSCRHNIDKELLNDEIFRTEKEFERMASEKGLAEAFYYFADENAVILRGNDSIIKGKENIKLYYQKRENPDMKLSWTPDFISVSDCGTLAYTYGKYIYSIQDSSGGKTEYTGVFHTVWKKKNNVWRFVWD